MPLPFPPDTQQFESQQRPFWRAEYWPTTFTPLRNDQPSFGIRMWIREPTGDGVFNLGAGSAFQVSLPSAAESTFDAATAKSIVTDGRTANLIGYWAGGAPGYHGATQSGRIAYHFKAFVRSPSARDWFSESNPFVACVACHGNGYFRVIHTPADTGVPISLVNATLDEKSFIDKAIGPFFSESATFETGDTVDFYYVQDQTPWGGFFFKMVPGGRPEKPRDRKLALREAPVIGCGLMDDGVDVPKYSFGSVVGGDVSRPDGQVCKATFRVPLVNTDAWDGVGWEWVKGLSSLLPPPPPEENPGDLELGAWTVYQQQNNFRGITFAIDPTGGFNSGPSVKVTIPPNSGDVNLNFSRMVYLSVQNAVPFRTYRLTAKVRTSWNVDTDDPTNGVPGIAMHWLVPPLAGVGQTSATSAAFGAWQTLTYDQQPLADGVLAPMLVMPKGANTGGPFYVWFSNVTLTDLTTSDTINLSLTFGGGSTVTTTATAGISEPDNTGFLRYHDFQDDGAGGADPITIELKRQRMLRLIGGFKRWDNTEEAYSIFTGFIDDFEGAGGGEVTVHLVGIEQRLVDQHVKNYPDLMSYMAAGFTRLSGTIEPVFPLPAYDNWPLELAIRDMLVRCGVDESRTRAPLLVPQADGGAIEVDM